MGFAAQAKLTMPILALGAEKSFSGPVSKVALGHWIMEEQPDATVKVVSDFLNKR